MKLLFFLPPILMTSSGMVSSLVRDLKKLKVMSSED
jgi:hypothetical protein